MLFQGLVEEFASVSSSEEKYDVRATVTLGKVSKSEFIISKFRETCKKYVPRSRVVRLLGSLLRVRSLRKLRAREIARHRTEETVATVNANRVDPSALFFNDLNVTAAANGPTKRTQTVENEKITYFQSLRFDG